MRLQPIRQTGDLHSAFERRREALRERHRHLSLDLCHRRAILEAMGGEAHPVELEHQEMLEQLESMTRKEIECVQNAIQRLRDGHYGICAICQRHIGRTRLEALPFTLLCLACTEAAER